MINTLHFQCINLPTSSYFKYRFDIVIDDKPLTQYLAEFNTKQSVNVGDKQQEVCWKDFVEGQSPLNLPKHLQQLLNFGCAATVMQCDCGQPECWSISAQVDCIGDYVTWSRFHHFGMPNKNHPSYVDYSQFQVFTFDKQQYLAEITKALTSEQKDKQNWVRK